MKKKIPFHLRGAKGIALFFFLAALLVGFHAGAQTDQPVSIHQVLDAHNAYRSEVGVPALTWSEDLAQFAQNWVNELANNRDCAIEHRPRDDNDRWKQHYGENIYSGGGTNWAPTFLDAIGNWGKEKANFDFDSKECKNGRCGHYTQMIWKNTTMVGCATAKCTDGNVIIVCNYDPPGNWMGEKPY